MMDERRVAQYRFLMSTELVNLWVRVQLILVAPSEEVTHICPEL